MNILEILQKHSDEDHRLSQKDIMDLLLSEYNMKADRKSIKRNLMNLIEFGYNIEYSENARMVTNKDGSIDESYILSDFYLVRDFTDGELRLLIDSLLFSKHLPYHQCEALIRKLENLSSKYFQTGVRHLNIIPNLDTGNNQLFLNIETLDAAIFQNRQVSFYCNDFGIDKKLHPHTDETGHPIRYIVNPYQISAVNGHYYLICSYHDHDAFDVFRLERITEIQLLDTAVKPLTTIQRTLYNSEIPVEVSENQQLYINGKIHAEFRFDRVIINDVIDSFGTDMIISEETGRLIAKVSADPVYLRRWALQNVHHAKVLTPKPLAEEIHQALLVGLQNYLN